MNVAISNFYQLNNAIRERSIRDVNQNRPNNLLAKWQRLRIATVETEIAMHRVKVCLNLLSTIPSKETLDVFSLSEGAWIDYHYCNWSFWMCSLMEKEIELVSQIGQKLIKLSNPQHKNIVRPLVESLVSRKDNIGKIRHPLAHKGEGGTTEAIMNTDLWKVSLILPSPIDFNPIFNSFVPSHMRWYNFLYKRSLLDFAEIERISEELYKSIDWGKI